MSLPTAPTDLSHPGWRPSLLLRDDGFDVRILTRADRSEQTLVDGVPVWIDPTTAATVRRLASLRPEFLFVESSAYGALLGHFGKRTWIRNPRHASRREIARLQRTALRAFDAVSFTNPAERAQWSVRPRQETELAYPVDVGFWATRVERRESWWHDRGWPVPEGPVLVCNSTFERHKRHRELIDSLAPLLTADPSMVLVLFGHRWHEPEIWDMVHTLPRRLGIDEQVRVTDWITYEEIRQLLSWATLTIINSERETQCLAVYEALAAGVPTLIAGIPELVTQFPHLPAHTNGEELRANVTRVVRDPDFGRLAVEASRGRVESADFRRHDDLFRETLGRLLGRSGP